MTLEAQNLSVQMGDTRALQEVSLTVRPGEWWALTGPNGAGKSTLIRAVAQGVDYQGKILFDGEDAREMPPNKIARHIGVLLQNHDRTYPFTVEEVVRLGRYAYSKGIFSKTNGDDTEKVLLALHMTGMEKLKDRSILSLSGGELQRTFLAQVFAQDPQLLILDEPANHLDIKYQKEILDMIEAWVRQPGRSVLSVMHDLSVACIYGTHAALMSEGRITVLGKPKEVFCDKNLQRTYHMDVRSWMKRIADAWA